MRTTKMQIGEVIRIIETDDCQDNNQYVVHIGYSKLGLMHLSKSCVWHYYFDYFDWPDYLDDLKKIETPKLKIGDMVVFYIPVSNPYTLLFVGLLSDFQFINYKQKGYPENTNCICQQNNGKFIYSIRPRLIPKFDEMECYVNYAGYLYFHSKFLEKLNKRVDPWELNEKYEEAKHIVNSLDIEKIAKTVVVKTDYSYSYHRGSDNYYSVTDSICSEYQYFDDYLRSIFPSIDESESFKQDVSDYSWPKNDWHKEAPNIEKKFREEALMAYKTKYDKDQHIMNLAVQKYYSDYDCFEWRPDANKTFSNPFAAQYYLEKVGEKNIFKRVNKIIAMSEECWEETNYGDIFYIIDKTIKDAEVHCNEKDPQCPTDDYECNENQLATLIETEVVKIIKQYNETK